MDILHDTVHSHQREVQGRCDHQQDLHHRLHLQKGQSQQRRTPEILRGKQSPRNHPACHVRQSARGTRKTDRQAKGQAGRHKDRARQILKQIRADRTARLRRMQNSVPPMHMDGQGQEKICVAVHQPTRLRQEILPRIPDHRRKRTPRSHYESRDENGTDQHRRSEHLEAPHRNGTHPRHDSYKTSRPHSRKNSARCDRD